MVARADDGDLVPDGAESGLDVVVLLTRRVERPVVQRLTGLHHVLGVLEEVAVDDDAYAVRLSESVEVGAEPHVVHTPATGMDVTHEGQREGFSPAVDADVLVGGGEATPGCLGGFEGGEQLFPV